MKKYCVLAALFLCSIVSAQGKYRLGQTPIDRNPNDYTISIHISAVHVRQCAYFSGNGGCGRGIFVDAVLNGKKVELLGSADKSQLALLVPGDYQAMLEKKSRAGGKEVLFQRYYMLLPDKSAWACEITGFSE